MLIKRAMVIAGALALLAGCTVRSLQPLGKQEDAVFDPGLVGTWAESADGEAWSFEKQGERCYVLTSNDDKDKKKLDACLFEFGGRQFLDIYAGYADDGIALPAHLFFKLHREGDDLKAATLEPEWTAKYLTANPPAVAHVLTGETLVLTASTEELRDFLLRHADDDGAFPPAVFFRRR